MKLLQSRCSKRVTIVGLRRVIFHARSVRSKWRKTVIRDYKSDVELFIVHCVDADGIYVIPIGDATRTQGTLRISPTANGQDKRVRWARDYELPA